MDIIESCDGCKFWINNICENEILWNILMGDGMKHSKPVNYGCKLSKEELETEIIRAMNEIKEQENGNTK